MHRHARVQPLRFCISACAVVVVPPSACWETFTSLYRHWAELFHAKYRLHASITRYCSDSLVRKLQQSDSIQIDWLIHELHSVLASNQSVRGSWETLRSLELGGTSMSDACIHKKTCRHAWLAGSVFSVSRL